MSPACGPTTCCKRGLACILLFHNGGPSQYETFDPKPGTAAGGPTKAIGTSVPGVMFGEDWPQTARQLSDIAIIRSMTAKEGNHVRAQYLMHTGFVPSRRGEVPQLWLDHRTSIGQTRVRFAPFRQYWRSRAGFGRRPVWCGLFAGGLLAVCGRRPQPDAEKHGTARRDRRAAYQRRLELMEKLEQDFADRGAGRWWTRIEA